MEIWIKVSEQELKDLRECVEKANAISAHPQTLGMKALYDLTNKAYQILESSR